MATKNVFETMQAKLHPQNDSDRQNRNFDLHRACDYCRPPETKLPFFEQSMGQKVLISNIPSDDAKVSLHCPKSIYAV